MDWETVSLSKPNAVGVATITLNRPKRKNAVNNQMYLDLAQALKACEGNDAVKAVILTGAGG